MTVMATTKLTAPNGVAVSVDSSKVGGLIRRGFTKDGGSTKTAPKKAAAKKTTAKKAASSSESE